MKGGGSDGGGGERSHGCLRREILKRVNWLCRIQRRRLSSRSGDGLRGSRGRERRGRSRRSRRKRRVLCRLFWLGSCIERC